MRKYAEEAYEHRVSYRVGIDRHVLMGRFHVCIGISINVTGKWIKILEEHQLENDPDNGCPDIGAVIGVSENIFFEARVTHGELDCG
jgi:hypothetical protein